MANPHILVGERGMKEKLSLPIVIGINFDLTEICIKTTA
jgi:hypothetical protein